MTQSLSLLISISKPKGGSMNGYCTVVLIVYIHACKDVIVYTCEEETKIKSYIKSVVAEIKRDVLPASHSRE